MTTKNPPALLVENLSVEFDRILDRPLTIKDLILRGNVDGKKQKVVALKNISFDVQHGEVFGIIGRNGAGKSTLMKVMAGLLKPTSGRMRIWGKTSSLLAVGAGFNKDLSGRENIHLFSSYLGRTAQRTKQLFDEIVDFSELEEFIDAPVRTYSSGMVARLGFAIAMVEQPEILLVDEVLGVGDEQFRAKCQKRFRDLRDAGATIVIITHHLGEVKAFCDRSAWLHKGEMKAIGNPDDVVNMFRAHRQKSGAVGAGFRGINEKK